MITATVYGRVTAEPNISTTSTGKKMASFSVAADTQFKNQNGEWITNFVRVAAFGLQADKVERHLKKGAIVTVVGPVAMKSYKAQDRTDRYNIEMLGNEILPGVFGKTSTSSAPAKGKKVRQPAASYEDDDEDPFGS